MFGDTMGRANREKQSEYLLPDSVKCRLVKKLTVCARGREVIEFSVDNRKTDRCC